MATAITAQSVPLADQLRDLGTSIQNSINDYIALLGENASESGASSKANLSAPPSHDLFMVRRSLIAAVGQLNSLVLPAKEQLVLLSAQHLESRVLHIVVAADVAGILERKGVQGEMELKDLARETGLEAGKLGRMLRLLCSLNIFREVRQDIFANNEISAKLAGDESFRSWVITFGLAMFSCANEMPTYLFHPDGRGHSYKSDMTPLRQCMEFKGKMFEWMGQKVRVGDLKEGRNGVGVPAEWGSPTTATDSDGVEKNGAVSKGDEVGSSPKKEAAMVGSFRTGYPGVYGSFLQDAIEGKADDEVVGRPEFGIHRMAMVGAGESGMLSEYDEFPWASLNQVTVVDVGSGIGGFTLGLSKKFPQLNIVLQDQPHMIKQAESAVWPKQHPEAISEGRVRFVAHDFFTPNPVLGAEVYYLRNVLLDWADTDVTAIMENLRVSMGKGSRVIISEIMLPITATSNSEMEAKTYGQYHRYGYVYDIAMMIGLNGRCRTPAQFGELAQKAGLRVKKVWDCRGHGGLVELVLPDGEL